MQLFRGTLILFFLNLADAIFTLIWVRSGVAEEGNQIMAYLLNIGDLPFLAVKIGMETLAAAVLLKFGRIPLARYGLTLALGLYSGLIVVHLLTGLLAFDLLPDLSRTQAAVAGIFTNTGM